MFGRITLVSILVLLFAVFSFAQVQPQPVWTWHNDIGRTGQQLGETQLNPTSLTTCSQKPCFGLLWQYPVNGQVYAQPLVINEPSGFSCSPCDVVFIATEEDMLYAFNADSSNTNALWSWDLAANAGGTYVDCRTLNPPCGNGVIYPSVDVTGTPVIDQSASILYVVTVVEIPTGSGVVQYWLHAINLTDGKEKPHSPELINASVTGAPTFPAACAWTTNSGTLSFDPRHHIQRAGLLLLNGTVYLAFAPVFGETQNGWVMAYTYNSASGFTQSAPPFNTTPFGTGGGVWESGAGLASDGTSIYVPTGNGSFDRNSLTLPNTDYGDSLIRLDSSLNEKDYFTPANQVSLCSGDTDFGSGGVLLIPDLFYRDQHQNLLSLAVSADKESKLFVMNEANLGGYTVGGPDNIVQEDTTPPPPLENQQGYWSTPAYWKYVDSNQLSHYLLYYAPESEDSSQAPFPINQYSLQSSGAVIPSTYVSTGTKFCQHAPTPSISANGSTQNTGILWAIENPNKDNPRDCNSNVPQPGVLHAYDATNFSNAELYNSSQEPITVRATKFLTPTIFNGRVYMGTLGKPPDPNTGKVAGEIEIFGLCSSQSGGCK